MAFGNGVKIDDPTEGVVIFSDLRLVNNIIYELEDINTYFMVSPCDLDVTGKHAIEANSKKIDLLNDFCMDDIAQVIADVVHAAQDDDDISETYLYSYRFVSSFDASTDLVQKSMILRFATR